MLHIKLWRHSQRLLLGYYLTLFLQWQQLKSKRLVRVLFGPVFRKSLGLSAVGLISLHSVQTLFLNHYKDYLSHRGSGQSTPLPPHVQDAIGQVSTCQY